MFKTLVSLGYHYNELEWGKIVRDTYIAKGMRGQREIIFYEVTKSNIPTGDFCPSSMHEIRDVFILNECDLWVDIHCGHEERYFGRFFLRYNGSEDEIIQAARTAIPDALVGSLNNIPVEHRPDWYNFKATVDPRFPIVDQKLENGYFKNALERTISFINQVHDIHI